MKGIAWGIDGCNAGWIAIGLDADGNFQHGVFESVQAFWEVHHATIEIVLIDMPIGLPTEVARTVESTARKRVKTRSSSFFPVPCRQALEFAAEHSFASDAYHLACDINEATIGKRFSKQSWNIMPKIYELDQFLQHNPSAQAYFYESHPELLFFTLNQHPLKYSKKQGLGFWERVKILEKYRSDALDIIRTVYDDHKKQLVDDDVADALVCAVAARLGNFQSISDEAKNDSVGLPMQMVYPTI